MKLKNIILSLLTIGEPLLPSDREPQCLYGVPNPSINPLSIFAYVCMPIILIVGIIVFMKKRKKKK